MFSEMKEIDYTEAVEFLLPRHYSGRKPPISYAYGYYEEGKLKAVCSIGKPASHSLCVGICGEEFSDKVYELNRLCVDGELNINLSEFVAYCLKRLKEHNLIIVSYADTQMNHIGYIYQATNWFYTGKTKSRTDKYVEGSKHSRHYKNTKQKGLRKFRSSKHRYVYFCASKRTKKKYLKNLNYDIQEYPKGENKRYTLGNFMKPIIIDSNNKNK